MHKFSPGTIPNPYAVKNSHKNKHFFRKKITCIHVLYFEEVNDV